MGYRSEVKSIVYGDKDLMDEFIKENTDLIEALEDDFAGHIEIIEKPVETFVYLNLDYAKWYESYSDVSRWLNLLKLANDAGLKFEFVRVGEEASVVEYNHSNGAECDYLLSVITTIECNL
jgi:hypothetical protein